MGERVFMNDMAGAMRGGDDNSREGLAWLMSPEMKRSYNAAIAGDYEMAQAVQAVSPSRALAIPQTRAIAVYRA